MSFEFDFTPEKLAECIHKNKNPQMWYDAFTEHFPTFEITTPARVAGFIAQCQHESLDFTVLQENLNYQAAGLMRVWPRLFPNIEIANRYAHQPEKIANRAYGGRLSNGPEESGDGWRFRGRGILQITGRANYTQCSRDLFNDTSLVEDPDLLRQPAYATLSACWFWHKNNLNQICDNGDIVLLSKRINGGTIGMEDRVKHWNIALDLFEGK